jgi:hypothetical protein
MTHLTSNSHLHTIINPIMAELTSIDKALVKDATIKLIAANYALGGDQYGFLQSGKFFTFHRLPPNYPKAMLHPDLRKQGLALVARASMLNKDTWRITQGLAQILKSCVSNQDVRDALPAIVLNTCNGLKFLSDIPRTRPEAWTIAHSEPHWHDYVKTKELIHFYVASRILC